MTYSGGVEDGMSAACARILRITRDKSLPDEDKLDMIEQYCKNVVKEPVREYLPDGPPISMWSPTPDEL
jgi:hypothetical protein